MSHTLKNHPIVSLVAPLGLALLVVATAATPAEATHPDQTTSAAIYRIPYADGTLVDVTEDAHNHGSCPTTNPDRGCDRIDMVAYDDNAGTRTSPSPGPATAGDGTAFIVAAASGTIAVIQDSHGNDYGRGDGLAFDGTQQMGMGNDNLEHTCQDATEDSLGNNDGTLDPAEDLDGDGSNDRVPNTVVVGLCQQHNNYVWIAHPNGEWTKYSHFRTGTVTTDQGWAVGDAVQVGQVLGEEGDVGFATGTHLHFEVANLGPYASYDTDGDGILLHEDADGDNVLDPGEDTNGNGILDSSELPANIGDPGGFMSGFQNHEPQVCDATTANYSYADDSDNTTTITAGQCANTAPMANAGGPYTVDEGSTEMLDGTASSDPHNAVLTFSWSPDTNLDDPTSPTPTYRGIDDAADLIDLTVSDVGGDVSPAEALTDTDTATVTVENVAPMLTIDPAQTTVINEHGTVSVVAEFEDPGILDTHGATIDWGAPVGDEGIELAPPAIQILDPGGPGQPLIGRVTGTYQYGDNDAGIGFAIEVTVTDDDGGSDTAGFGLTVGNVDPGAEIDLSGAILINGVPTIIGEAGVPLELSGRADDPGSDDLTFHWSFGDGETASPLSRVNPPLDDSLPSPTVQPRVDVGDLQEHAFGDACMYETSLQVSDDDAGVGPTASAVVLIAGNADDSRPAGWWQTQYKFGGKLSDFSADTLACYLAIARFGSMVFEEERSLATLDDAHAVLHKQGTLGQHQKNLDRELLTAWLNFANGVFDYHELVVDTDDDGAADLSFADALTEAETVRLDPEATTGELVAARQLVHEVNQP